MPTSFRNPYENTVYQQVVEAQHMEPTHQAPGTNQSFRKGPANEAYSRAAASFYFDNSMEPCRWGLTADYRLRENKQLLDYLQRVQGVTTDFQQQTDYS